MLYNAWKYWSLSNTWRKVKTKIHSSNISTFPSTLTLCNEMPEFNWKQSKCIISIDLFIMYWLIFKTRYGYYTQREYLNHTYWYYWPYWICTFRVVSYVSLPISIIIKCLKCMAIVYAFLNHLIVQQFILFWLPLASVWINFRMGCPFKFNFTTCPYTTYTRLLCGM